MTVSPVSCPVLYFGLKGRCVLQVRKFKNLQLCTVNKMFDANELEFCPLEPELIRFMDAWSLRAVKGLVLEAEEGTQTSSHRVQDGREGLQQQHKQQRERLAHSSWPLIPGTKSGAENAFISKSNMIKINS